MHDLDRIAQIFNDSPINGSFKLPTRLATYLGKWSRDFLYFDPIDDSVITRFSEVIWEERFLKERDNIIFLGKNKESIKRNKEGFLNRLLGISGLVEQNVFSIVCIPGKFCRTKGFSLDERQGVGTANFGLDFAISRDSDFDYVCKILKKNRGLVIGLIKNLVVSYKGKQIDLHKYFNLGDRDNYYALEFLY